MNNKEILVVLNENGADIEGVTKRFCGDLDLYVTCFRGFFGDSCIESLFSLMGEGRYSEAFLPAHTLKGLSGNLGLSQLYNVTSVLVELLRCGDFPGAAAQFASVEKQFSVLRSLFPELCH